MRVVVAMSGGVDSSVAALLMRDAGHEVIGVSLQLWDYSGTDANKFGTCCSPDDLYDARRVCQDLSIPYYVLNAEAAFRQYVVDGFKAAYASGVTPSPCVHCNDHVKFDRLLAISRGLGAEMLVTGHYARRITLPGGRNTLLKAVDKAKDQSYFLFNLDQDRLARIWFPLGTMMKQEVRELAQSRGLPTASKHESQELCFVPENDYARFLEGEGGGLPAGDIVDIDGKALGRHRGLHHYTIGQRKGLGISSGEALYVVALEPATNRLVVGPDQALYLQGLVARGVRWICGEPEPDVEVRARIRSRAQETATRLTGLEQNRYEVRFALPQRAITPGQAIVFYQDEEVLGGGWIERGLSREVTASVGSYDV